MHKREACTGQAASHLLGDVRLSRSVRAFCALRRICSAPREAAYRRMPTCLGGSV